MPANKGDIRNSEGKCELSDKRGIVLDIGLSLGAIVLLVGDETLTQIKPFLDRIEQGVLKLIDGN